MSSEEGSCRSVQRRWAMVGGGSRRRRAAVAMGRNAEDGRRARRKRREREGQEAKRWKERGEGWDRGRRATASRPGKRQRGR